MDRLADRTRLRRALGALVAAGSLVAAVTLTGTPDDSRPTPAPRPARPDASSPAPAPLPPPRAPAGVGLIALRSGDAAATDAGRYDVVVLNAWEAAWVPKLKRANPGVRALVYKDMSSTRSYAARDGVDDARLPTGVGYAEAERDRPEWFLADQRGRRVEWRGYPGHWWMDVGDAAYAERWAANVSAQAAAEGWDGVMIDNAMPTPAHYLPPGRTLARYPDDTAYADATERFLAAVAPRLRAAGLSVVPNLGANFEDAERYRRWLDGATGVLREHYGRWGSDGHGAVLTGPAWDHQLTQHESVQGAGRMFLAVAYARPGDVPFQRYARASFLLAWDGGPSALAVTPPTAGHDPWTPDATAAVGMPAGPRVPVGAGWMRPYTDGVVVVNPSPSASVTFALGQPHRHPDAGPVTEVTLPPASGLVLPVGA